MTPWSACGGAIGGLRSELVLQRLDATTGPRVAIVAIGNFDFSELEDDIAGLVNEQLQDDGLQYINGTQEFRISARVLGAMVFVRDFRCQSR